MKKELFSLGILIAGGSFLSAITGYGNGDDFSEPKAVGKQASDVSLSEDMRRDLDLEIGLVELRKVTESIDPVIAVPKGAINYEDTGGAFVYSKEDALGDDFSKTRVETGASESGYVEILSGLFPGDSVVVKNAGRIPTNSNFADTAKGGDAKPVGGFVDRSKEVEPAEVGAETTPEGNDIASPKCTICGEASVAKGICRNGYCEAPIEPNRFVCPPAAPRANGYRNYGGGIYCEPSFGPGYGSSYCPPAPCRW